MVDGRYRNVLGAQIPFSDPPPKGKIYSSDPPPKSKVKVPESDPPHTIHIEGGGWKAKIPLVVLTSLIAAVGVRMIPSPSPTDTAIAAIQRSSELRDLREERFREEIRLDLDNIRKRLDQAESVTINRFGIIEARLERIREDRIRARD